MIAEKPGPVVFSMAAKSKKIKVPPQMVVVYPGERINPKPGEVVHTKMINMCYV